MQERPNRQLCLLATPFRQLPESVRLALQEGISLAGYDLVPTEQIRSDASSRDSVINTISASDCIMAWQPVSLDLIGFELGLALGMGKPVLIIINERDISTMPPDFFEVNYLVYSEFEKALFVERLQTFLRGLRELPPMRRSTLSPLTTAPFYVDWDTLEPREIENLCRELLSQMGFIRLDWGMGSREIDLVAELPKKDPDGFEYRELWLVSLGLRVPTEMLLDMASHNSLYLFHQLSLFSENFNNLVNKDANATTLLLIAPRSSSNRAEIEMLRERLESKRFRSKKGPHTLRFRFWDQEYLTSLVHKFPVIGYKYFSSEGRIRSKTRKSYEDLYQENSELLSRLSHQNKALQDEKNRRISAERDAVWKDISFSAAHKIGNPIFAIETDLEPLQLRVNSGRRNEAIEVIENIRSAVEKAKSIVDQFKSLTKAQEIHPNPIAIKPILEDACRTAKSLGVDCSLSCGQSICVYADNERLSECFDELIINACNWFDKETKHITIEVIAPAPAPLPDFLETSLSYVLVRVSDNGPGIKASDKTFIFDAFFTKRPHGTGLGLALVKRIIDGHNGGIIEIGIPGEGAKFEIFLPMPTEISEDPMTKKVRKRATRVKVSRSNNLTK